MPKVQASRLTTGGNEDTILEESARLVHKQVGSRMRDGLAATIGRTEFEIRFVLKIVTSSKPSPYPYLHHHPIPIPTILIIDTSPPSSQTNPSPSSTNTHHTLHLPAQLIAFLPVPLFPHCALPILPASLPFGRSRTN